MWRGARPPSSPPGAEQTYINPVPGGLVLTGIVVAVSTSAFALALTQRLYRKYGTTNLDLILIRAQKGVE